jgi:glycosyltransferase involved in cell wall biosynthesis
MKPIRLAVAMTHPIQYYSPWFRHIAHYCPDIDLCVVYASDPSAEQVGVGFNRPVRWGVPLLEGYPNRVVGIASATANVHSDVFWGLNVPGLARAIVEFAPDVALVPGWYSVSLVRALLACRRAGIPVLYRGDNNLIGQRRGVKGLAWRARTRLLLRLFDVYLSVGLANRAYLEAFVNDRTRIFDVPHFVDNDFFAATAAPHQTAEARAAARRAWALGDDDFVMLFAGKLEAKKRPADVIHAAAQLGAGASVLMVGAGEQEAECRRAAQSGAVRVAWAGFLDQSEIGRAYAAADCLVLPSTSGETWGLVVNEAMATGLPCVVSDEVGCAADLVSPGETGEVFRCGDVTALAEALRRVRERRLRGHDYASGCRARVARYSIAQATRGLVSACRAAIGSRP